MRTIEITIGYVAIGRIKETTKGWKVCLLTPVDAFYPEYPFYTLKKQRWTTLNQAADAVARLFPMDMRHNVKFWEFDGIEDLEIVI